jgi:hypothetical protein
VTIEGGIGMALLKLPYGNADFHDIRTGNFFYVDKTTYIEKLKQLHAKYLFFIRPQKMKTPFPDDKKNETITWNNSLFSARRCKQRGLQL